MARTFASSFAFQDLVVDVVAFELVRELGRAPRADVEIRLPVDLAAENAVGERSLLTFGYGGDPGHTFAGVIEEVELVGSPLAGGRDGLLGAGSAHVVRVTVVSELALLEGSIDARIYQELDARAIVTAVLEEHGIPASRQRWRTTTTLAKRTYCVRYFESALAFVARLCEEEGIWFSTEVDDGEEIVVFGDDTRSAPPIEGDAALPFKGERGFAVDGDGVVTIVEEAELCAGKIVLADYDFTRPSLDLTATAEADADTALERYDYPGRYVEPERGAHLARVRLEAERARRERLVLVADCPRLTTNRKVELVASAVPELDAAWMVYRVVHRLGEVKRPSDRVRHEAESALAPRQPQDANVALAEAELVPLGVRFRTAQATPRPVIDGPQTARVVAPAGADSETIHTDEHGRCKVKFPWDVVDVEDDKASCFLRVAQLQTSGSMILPRLDWEVIVEFLEGDPDRPVVTGMLYNGQFMPPYALPEGKTRTSLRTRSTPGGGGSNEIRFEDAKGGEEIMIHAQHDQTIATANDKRKTVGNCESRTVKVNETIEVGGDQSVQITKGFQTTVGGNRSVTVGGNQTTSVNAVAGLTASGNSDGLVGGNHFELDGNPLEGLLALATETITELAKEGADKVLEAVNEAVKDKVAQVMGRVGVLVEQADTIAKTARALKDGDLMAAGDVIAEAREIPGPTALANAFLGGDAPVQEVSVDEIDEETVLPTTESLGIDALVHTQIERGVAAGMGALGEAMGIGGGEGGGGASGANVEGPEGTVAGIDTTDRAKGPGHSTLALSGNLSETIGALKIVGALGGIVSESKGAWTETIGAAKIRLALGDVKTDVGSNLTETALARLAFVKGDEEESAGVNRVGLTGGAVMEQVAGGHSVEAGAAATFIGAFHKLEAKTSITFKCGACEVVIDEGGITITAPMVTLLAPKIQLTKSVSEV
jgi:type VI secretion system secreted protein VgrG